MESAVSRRSRRPNDIFQTSSVAQALLVMASRARLAGPCHGGAPSNAMTVPPERCAKRDDAVDQVEKEIDRTGHPPCPQAPLATQLRLIVTTSRSPGPGTRRDEATRSPGVYRVEPGTS